ncbi:pantetheine-phosphate adenylyltransferase [Candidatus Mcinerneyibacteriota bacterium]|nr:pantetheine-phosphate adenylyltransferase [Candidatus Mcinerneyibacteriota bacterium]
MKKGLYPGTFDPITRGHIDIIERSLKIFDHLIIAVARNEKKHPLFTVEERVDMIRKTYDGDGRITVEPFDGLLVKFVKEKNLEVIIRGMRAISDFEYEMQIALTNRKLDEDFETLFLMPSIDYIYLNASVVRELASLGADLKTFVTPYVEERLREKYPVSR